MHADRNLDESGRGLVPAADPSYEVLPSQQRRRRLCEAVISANSPLIGKTIREADFRAAYGAAVVAVHGGGSRVEKKIGDVRPVTMFLLIRRPTGSESESSFSAETQ